ncbi:MULTISPECIES: non-ribosomal peptide synthetase [Lysobacter]|uniref:non-ribosomal peptide synthetase n=1 Tax=Lysobacter TaxID=68 RepID=UPI001F3DFD4C|nr:MULTISPECIES: non-ribosomal peptide synthetase [Lysobacter]UJB21510.1 amino acid adenylation domain-containing protein [Lysobacter capsici]UJQ29373.1 amino acid adenylation domain-containing protein [Lysobacter gummosus]
MRTDTNRQKVLADPIDRDQPSREYPCAHELFERQVELAPSSIAIHHDGRDLSYAEVNMRANRLARYLRGLGIDPDDRVAICMPRCAEMIIAMLAVTKAGAAYLPLDPAYPRERLNYMVADSGARILLTMQAQDDFASVPAGPIAVALDQPNRPWELLPTHDLAREESGAAHEHLAYVIYTSGSTGQPKGVMVEHRNLRNLIEWHCEAFALQRNERSSCMAGLAFDACAWEIWPTLCMGATLVLAPSALAGDPVALLQWWQSQDLHSSFLVTAFAEMAMARAQPGKPLRRLLTGGDRLSRLPGKDLPYELINNYGPTETTVVATSGRVRADDKVLHIGRPIANTSIYLLDTDGAQVAEGDIGEIHIGGASVARGYLNRPELTAERFLDDPFAGREGARMYRTGDLGRWLPDGTIEFLGRNDDQVKIRGFRIELGEIEAQLAKLPGVSEAVVHAREDSPGDKRLVAYLVGDALPQTTDLRAALARELPEYMVPAAYVTLERLPLTPNGKLDRRALPAPEGDAYAQRAYEAPQGAVETALAQIWSELLQVEQVGRQDHFFELGGHSLLAVQLMERMRHQQLYADIRTLFAQPTLSALAQAVEQARQRDWREVPVPANGIEPGCTELTPQMLPLVSLDNEQLARIVDAVPGGAGNIQDIYPLAPLQEGILFHHLLHPQGDPYLLSTTLAFDSRERLDGFVQALQTVIDRHDVLRTAVQWEGLPEPVQVVWREATIEVETLVLDGADVEAHLRAYTDPSHYRLDVRSAPQMRGFAAFDASQQRWLLVLLQHHLIMDHITSDLLMQELALIQSGRGDELSEPVPFRDFVAQARLGVSVQEHESYFREMLGDVEEPTAPFGLKDVQGGGQDIREAHRAVDSDLSRRIRAQVKALGVSAASVFHWAWGQVLAKTTGQEDVVFGTVLFGRMHGGSRADRAMGLFINTLPVRIRLGEASVRDSIRRTHASLSQLVWHEHAPLALAQRCSALPSSTPLFSALLNYHYSAGALGIDLELGWGEGVELLDFKERTNYAFNLSVDDQGQDFHLGLQITSKIDAQRIGDYMHRVLEQLVDALEHAPETPAWRIGVLAQAERQQVLEAHNATQRDYSQGQCVHRLFEQQAVRTPEAIAAEQDGHSLSYAELNARANRLAHHLRTLGVGADDRVAIGMPRSLDLVVSLLAVLKAGGAYVPLDPAYPSERLAYMLGDSAPKVLLTHSEVRDHLPAGGSLTVLEVDRDASAWQSYPAQNLDPAGLSANNLAYVIYTSGSTGQPKGVMVEHANLANLIRWHSESFPLQPGERTASTAGVAFDACTWEIWPALNMGATLALPPRDTAGDPMKLLQWWESQDLHSSFLVTALAEIALGRAQPGKPLRSLLTGGDRLSRLPDHDLPYELINNYGPTETTVVATSGRLDANGAIVHIGRPIANTTIYLLDAHGEPVPEGVAGEIHVGGAGVARGYLNRPELTAERFLDDPFAGREGARMYRTGDLGRWLPDGTIEFLGRNDHQVKIRGFRIELGEIEAQLAQLPGVREAAVHVREDSPGDKRLVAYLVGEGIAPSADLRAALARDLPDYMVPAAYVLLAQLPLTPNGKLDRHALPAPDGDAYAQRAFEEPQGEVETALAQIWAELLQVPRVGRRDHFFELGGHSLLAMRLLSRVSQRLKLSVSLPDLFATPVLCEFARTLAQAGHADMPALLGGERPALIPLSFAQQRLWFIAQMGEQASAAHHIPLGLRLSGDLDETALQASLQRIVQRHEALRTYFELVEGEPVQRIAEDAVFALTRQDLSASADPQAELTHWRQLEAQEPFHLDQGPLIRGRLLRLGKREHVLLLTLHHIVSDGWSMGVLIEELDALYRAYSLEGVPTQVDPLPALPVQYADYAVWQRRWLDGALLHNQQNYWREHLQGAPGLLELPTDRARPPVQEHAGESRRFSIDADLSRELHALSQRHGTTLYMTLLAAWAALLSRLSGQSDLVVGTPMVNRNHTELEPLIGMFVNTLALRFDLSDDPSVAQLLAQARTTTLAAQANIDLPFEQVVETLKPVRSLAYTPLYQVVFVMQNEAEENLRLADLQVEALASHVSRAQTDLWWSITQAHDDLQCEVVFATSLFDADTIERWIGHWQVLLRAMVADQAQAVSRLPLLSPAQRDQVLLDWNDTARPLPPHQHVHAWFEAQAAGDGAATALVCEGLRLSYAELNARANRLAHHLIALGVRPDHRVALAMERGADLIVAMLATLKAGGAYVPLDTQYPPDRLAFMLDDSRPKVVLTQASVQERLPASRALMTASVVELDDPSAPWRELSDADPDPVALGLTCDHLAYVIYTSGSTGKPKGVMVPHRGLCNLVAAQSDALAVDAGSRVLQCASLSFDASVFEIVMALCHASILYLPAPGELLAGAVLARAVREHAITHVTLTPAVLMTLEQPQDLASVRTLVVAGDACPQALVERWSQGRRFVNAYGPTESTIWATFHACDISEDGHPPIGRPIANAKIYLLDGHGEPVPVGVTGEIHIGGAGVARGYLNRAELTRERFLDDPFAAEPGARVYKSGDLARWRADGVLEFLGRNDAQVKLRGFRIELGEIETQLTRLLGVQEAIVLPREDSPGDKRLVAYLLGPAVPEAQELRIALSKALPEYMVPSAFVTLQAWPLTPNGKLDRKALPSPDGDAYIQREYEAPQGEIETVLADIWTELLRIERVGRRDHFFEIGGHSLLAMQLTSRVRQRLGQELELASVFGSPVLCELAELVRQAETSTLPAIRTGQRPSAVPLSFAQQRLWFLAQMGEEANAAYHVPGGLRLHGRLDEQALQAALDRIVQRHEVLRTCFGLEDGQPVQCIAAHGRFSLVRHDLSGAGDLDAQVAHWSQIEAHEAFDLGAGPLIRGRLLRLGDQDHILLLTVHHVVSDGWSMSVLMRELGELYRAYAVDGVAPQDDPLPPLPVQYADYAVWQRQWLQGAVLQRQVDFWREHLHDAPTLLELPTDRPRPVLQDLTGGTLTFELDPGLSQGLRELSKRHGTTLYMTLLAAWAAMLGRLSGQEDLVIGTAGVNRSHAEVEPLIGFFVNTLALRIDLSGEPSVAELLARIRKTALAAQAHNDVPFQQVVEAVKPARSLAHTPLYQVAFVMQNTPEGALRLPGMEITPIAHENTAAQIDVWWSATEIGDRIECSVVYAAALFDAQTVQRWSRHWQTLLREMVDGDARRIGRLSLLSPGERRQVLEEWNDTRRPYPHGVGVVQRVQAQAQQAGAVTALTHEDGDLSYAELNARANRLAHHLVALGVRPDQRVALLLERGPQLVVAMLATLKAGGAYVPLDPQYPSERLAFMLDDSRPKVVLTQASLEEQLPASRALMTASVLVLDDAAAPWQRLSDADPDPAALGITANHLAYVIYTSGSTGQPKGVMVERANLANLVNWHSETFPLQAGERTASTAGIAFDACTWEVWPALSMGATLALPPRDTVGDPMKLLQWWESQDLHSSFLVTALAEIQLGRAQPGQSLRSLLTGGDRLNRLPERDLPYELINNYGPTETTVVATSGRLRCDDKVVHIGRPIANTSIYLLDAHGEPVPQGVAGEIHIGGASVARGYLNRPELTAERFLDDPFAGREGARMYRTGDLGRWLADGTIEFLGRNDHQVKIRGFRIELGEIEARLAKLPGVREAVVHAREDSPGDKRLVAYLVGEALPQTAELRAALAQELPEYMVPAAYMALERLPLTPNGKLDRRALPAPEGDAYAQQRYEEPQGDIENNLAAVWMELLKLPRVGRHDDFFEIGGHSLMATQLVSRIRREWELDIPLAEVFSNPTLSALSGVIVDYELSTFDPQEIQALLAGHDLEKGLAS